MSYYALPTSTDWVTASWQDHRNRNPPSSEPGTDYGAGYGSPLYAVEAGTVADLSHSNAGGTGRYITVDLDDGRRTRSLHLAEIWVAVGNRVARGQQLGLTGASGHGSDWGYGAHVHQTLFPAHAYDFGNTLDFALYVGAPPGSQEDDMAFTIYQNGGRIMVLGPETFLEIGAELTHQTGVDGGETLALYQGLPGTQTVPLNGRQYDVLRVHTIAANAPPPASDAQAQAANQLTGPAWVVGFFLGLIGLVEVVRLVFELLT